MHLWSESKCIGVVFLKWHLNQNPCHPLFSSRQMRKTEAGRLKGARRDRQTSGGERRNWFVAIATGSGAASLQTTDSRHRGKSDLIKRNTERHTPVDTVWFGKQTSLDVQTGFVTPEWTLLMKTIWGIFWQTKASCAAFHLSYDPPTLSWRCYAIIRCGHRGDILS